MKIKRNYKRLAWILMGTGLAAGSVIPAAFPSYATAATTVDAPLDMKMPDDEDYDDPVDYDGEDYDESEDYNDEDYDDPEDFDDEDYDDPEDFDDEDYDDPEDYDDEDYDDPEDYDDEDYDDPEDFDDEDYDDPEDFDDEDYDDPEDFDDEEYDDPEGFDDEDYDDTDDSGDEDFDGEYLDVTFYKGEKIIAYGETMYFTEKAMAYASSAPLKETSYIVPGKIVVPESVSNDDAEAARGSIVLSDAKNGAVSEKTVKDSSEKKQVVFETKKTEAVDSASKTRKPEKPAPAPKTPGAPKTPEAPVRVSSASAEPAVTATPSAVTSPVPATGDESTTFSFVTIAAVSAGLGLASAVVIHRKKRS